ncbi:MAG: restriction endonuclease subunit S [Candidatus Omnitrophica bacterium]|nr:restriction endonuclease subunit S [Candidatus Omnitrophota bacterium]
MRKEKSKVRLEEITDIISGHLFKNRISTDDEGNVSVIQLRDVTDEGNILYNQLSRVKLGKIGEDRFIKKNDIIFKAKSNKRIAALVGRDVEGLVATGHYFIIRELSPEVKPEYLVWFLNNSLVQKYFDSHARGTRIPIINKEILGNVEIIIPDIKTQEKIVAVNELYVKEKILIEQISEKRKLLVDTILNSAIIK